MEFEVKDKFLKLSHQAHKTVPSIIEFLQLKVSEKYGRHIITTHKLRTGDIVAIVKPFYKSLDKNKDKLRCSYCFKLIHGRITCVLCLSVSFCSDECQKLAWSEFHKLECSSIDIMSEEDGFLMMLQRSIFKALNTCGDVHGLQTLIDANPSPLTVYDLNFNDPDLDKSLLLVCHSLEEALPSPRELILVDQLINHHKTIRSLWKTDKERIFLKSFILKLNGIMYRNSFTLHWSLKNTNKEDIGCAIIPFASMFNHSCSPNLYRFCVDDNVVFMAKRPIEANEQLFISYQHQFYQARKEDRQKSLQRQFNFLCSCEACSNNFPIFADFDDFGKDFECPTSFSSLEEAERIFHDNCNYIELNNKDFPNYQLIQRMKLNYRAIQYILCYQNQQNFL